MSKFATQTVALSGGDVKLLVLDMDDVDPDKVFCRIVSRGKVLPKGATPTEEHVFIAKTIGQKKKDGTKTSTATYKLTRDAVGKYKQYNPLKVKKPKNKPAGTEAKKTKKPKTSLKKIPAAAPRKKKEEGISKAQFDAIQNAVAAAMQASGK